LHFYLIFLRPQYFTIRSVIRVTRRYHVIDRISRRLGSLGGYTEPPQPVNGHSVNGHGVNVNGVNGHSHHQPPRVPPPHGEPTIFLRAELNGRQPPPPPPQPASRLGRYSRYLNGGDNRCGLTRNGLEKQILIQQAEICSLRNGGKKFEQKICTLQLSGLCGKGLWLG
jgi:hypothetical protein